MSGPLLLGFVWLLAANLIALIAAPLGQRRASLLLVLVGIPLLGWITKAAGPIWGLAFLLGGTLVLRWPPLRLSRALRPAVKKPGE